VCIYFLKKLETEVICTKLDHLKTRSAAMTEPKLEKLEKLSCCISRRKQSFRRASKPVFTGYFHLVDQQRCI
jgi:hypothetical protein